MRNRSEFALQQLRPVRHSLSRVDIQRRTKLFRQLTQIGACTLQALGLVNKRSWRSSHTHEIGALPEGPA